MTDWGEFNEEVLAAMCQKYVMHNGEFTSSLWFIAPAGCDRVPNAVLQPLVLTWIYWAGWSLTRFNMRDQVVLVAVIEWWYPGENLIGMGQLDQTVR